MKICLYTNTALPLVGGQEMVVDALARQLSLSSHDVVVLAPGSDRSDGTFPYEVVRHPPFFSTRRLIGWYGVFLRRLHRRRRFDVIHCHGVSPAGYVATLNRERLRCPIVITGHGEHTSARRLATPARRRSFRYTVDHADALIAISQSIRDGYLSLSPDCADRIADIPNGVDVQTLGTPVTRPRELPASIPPRGYFLFVGRLKRRKGVDVLIEAMALLNEPSAHCVIAGDGEEREELERLAKTRGVDSNITFAGRVSGEPLTYLYQNALGLMMPSRGSEGLPLVALESFAAGRPIIGSDIPGLTELVRPGETGILVPQENASAFADAMRSAIADPDSLNQFGNAVREIAEQQSWQAIANRHLELYESLLA